MRICVRKIHHFACIVLATAIAVRSADGADALEIVGTHASQVSDNDPELYRIVIRNPNSLAKKIKYLVVPNADGTTRSVGARDEQILWWRADEPIQASAATMGQRRAADCNKDQRAECCRMVNANGTTPLINHFN